MNKDLEIFKMFLEKGFKIKLYDKNDIYVLVFILSLFEANDIIKK